MYVFVGYLKKVADAGAACACRFDPVVSTLQGLVPDGFIYLHATPETCMRRLTSRRVRLPAPVPPAAHTCLSDAQSCEAALDLKWPGAPHVFP